MDPSVIQALKLAVANDPENSSLRLHLAEIFLKNSQANEAIEHCKIILSKIPDHAQALQLARDCALALNDSETASRYDRILSAIAPEMGDQPDSQKKTPLRVVHGGVEDVEVAPELEKPTIRLEDVAGMDAVKRRLNLSFLAPLKNPELLKAYGKSLRGGLLLYGPPGCGKTFIARATAGELNARFISVGLNDVLDMWLGQSERNLHEIFESARRNAPCVLFFDEIDALGRKRALMRHSSEHNIVNQLLSEMDSIQTNNEGIFVLAATNHPWDVDVALRRPGRLDRIILVLPPDKQARGAIIRLHLRNRPVDQDLDIAWMAAHTEDFSGADLSHLCESAAEIAMEESLTTQQIRSIRLSDFKKAMKETKPTTKSWFEIAKNYAMFANEGGIYDDLVQYLRSRKFV